LSAHENAKVKHCLSHLCDYTPFSCSQTELERFRKSDQDFTKKEYEKLYQCVRNSHGGRFHKVAGRAGHNIHSVMEKTIKDIERLIENPSDNPALKLIFGISWERFLANLTSLKGQEILKASECRIFNPLQDRSDYRGTCFITLSHFCYSYVHFTISGHSNFVLVRIPFVEMTAITKAGKKHHHDHVHGRFGPKSKHHEVTPLQDKMIKPGVIQIWSDQEQLHQFYGFGPDFDDIYNTLHGYWVVETNHKNTITELGLITEKEPKM